jgi:very-short-patch-repair endonuclease
MRNDPTNAEARLWAHLRKGQMGWRFRRQHVVAGFIVDFYCAALKVAVEVDGPVHEGRRDYDVWRDESLRQLGVATVRLRNDDVLDELPATLVTLHAFLSKLATRSPPPDFGGRTGGGLAERPGGGLAERPGGGPLGSRAAREK